MTRKSKEFDFEKSLNELEKLVALMEDGDLSLEDSLKHFERGIELTRACHKALADAEHKVQVLIKNNDNKEELVSFDADRKVD
ncbi:MAG: exodeoxyribonuclease VII small subunit [Gammaproteobacteria bacterium]